MGKRKKRLLCPQKKAESVLCAFFLLYLFSMRKFIAMALVLVVFAGCKAKDEQVVLENPQQTFTELTARHRDAWKDTILGLLPEMEAYEKSKSSFSLKGNAAMADESTIDFAFDANGEADMTNAEDPLMKTALSAEADLKGGAFEGNAKASLEMIVANASIFLSLKELAVDFPDFPTSEILDPIRQHVGKWYGDTFVSLNEQTGMDIQKTYLNRLNNPAEVREKIGAIITDTELFTMKSYVGEENGMYRFDVELNKPELRSALEAVMNMSAVTEAQKQQALADFDADMANLTVTGVLGLDQNDPKYFSFDGTITDATDAAKSGTIKMAILKEKKTVDLAQNGETTTLTIDHTEAGDAFSVTQGKADKAPVETAKGTIGETTITLAANDVETAKPVFELALNKTGDTWAGTAKMLEEDKVVQVVEIGDLAFTKDSLNAKLVIKNEEEKEVMNMTIAYQTEAAETVSIVSPESYDQFSVLLQNFLPLMMMGAPGLTAPGMTAPMPGLPADTGSIPSASGLPMVTDIAEMTIAPEVPEATVEPITSPSE